MKQATKQFIEDMFDNESKLNKQQFIDNLNKEQFKWLFDSEMLRSKVDLWTTKGFPKN